MAQGYSVTFSVVDNATKQIDAINKRLVQLRAPQDALAKSMSKFINVSGLKSVAQGFEGIAKSAASAASAVTSIVPAMGALTAAGTLAGLAKMVSDFGALGEQLTKTGILLGDSPEKLYGVAQAMRYFGGNAETAIEALKELKNAQYDATLGMNAMAQYTYTKLGVALTDGKKHFRDVVDVQHDLFAALDRIPNEMDRVRAAMKAGGSATAELYQQYQYAGVSLDEWTRKQKELATLNAQQIKAFNDMELALGPLNSAFYDLGATVGSAVAPVLTELFNDLNNYIKAHKGELTAEIDGWVKAFEGWAKSGGPQKVIDDLGKIATAAEKVMEVGEWLAAHPALAGALLGAYAGSKVGGGYGAIIGGAAGAVTGYELGQSQADQAYDYALRHNQTNLSREEFVKQYNANPPAAPAAGGAPAAPPGGVPAPAAPSVPAAPAPGGGLIAPGALNPTVGVAPGPQGAAAPGAPAAFGRAIEQVESSGGTNYNNEPLKGHSATGPRQMMPSTFAEFARPGERIDNPEDNRRVSDRYINYLWNKYGGDPAKVAYAYANGSLVSPDKNPGYVRKLMSAYTAQGGNMQTASANPTAPTPDSMVRPPNVPGGTGDVLDKMYAMAGTRGKDVREFLRDPTGKIQHDPDLGNWCAEFVGAYLQHMGVPHAAQNLMAASYQTFGQAVAAKDISRGDVLLNYNLKHVGVATGRTWLNTPGHAQGDIEEYSSNSIVNGQLTNLPGFRWRHGDVYARRSQELAVAEARGQPGTMLAGGAMPNGNVNVAVTHRNAPANVEVTAYATGGGINLNPPRVEHQQMGQI